MLEHSSRAGLSNVGYPDPTVTYTKTSGHTTEETHNMALTYTGIDGGMKVQAKAVILRFVRMAILTVLALASGYVVSPEVLDLVGQSGAVIVSAIVVPALAALDKYLRDKWQIKKVLAARAAAADRTAGTPNVIHVHQIIETGETRPATEGETEMGKVSRTLLPGGEQL